MPRKSRELRLNQTNALIAEYSKAGIGHADRSFRFMNDMSARLERGKGLSKGQRDYLDSLIDQGVPKPKNEEKVKEILEAAKVDGMQDVASTLKDFAYKLGKGWNLSEKQENFLQSLLSKSEKLKENGRYRPTPELVRDLKAAVAVCDYKNSWYWNHRPGTAKAYDRARKWLAWDHQRQELEKFTHLQEAAQKLAQPEPIMDEWVCKKLINAFKKTIEELNSPKHPAGMMRWTNWQGEKQLMLIAGEPKLERGTVVYPCLVDGQDRMIPSERIKKRRG